MANKLNDHTFMKPPYMNMFLGNYCHRSLQTLRDEEGTSCLSSTICPLFLHSGLSFLPTPSFPPLFLPSSCSPLCSHALSRPARVTKPGLVSASDLGLDPWLSNTCLSAAPGGWRGRTLSCGVIVGFVLCWVGGRQGVSSPM